MEKSVGSDGIVAGDRVVLTLQSGYCAPGCKGTVIVVHANGNLTVDVTEGPEGTLVTPPYRLAAYPAENFRRVQD